MQAEPRHGSAAPDRVFDFMGMFNKLILTDEALATRLPKDEFELSFDCKGNVYINGQPLGINVEAQLEASSSK